MARPRKPNFRKQLHGTLRPDRALPRDPVERLPRCPPPPAHVSAGAAVEWRRLAPVVHQLGALTYADLRAFELLCETLATETHAREIATRDGMSTPTADGGSKPSSALRALEKARDQLVRLLGEFGLTPRSRIGVERAPVPANNAVGNGDHRETLDDFLARRPEGI